jgi:hypothetical protein
MKRAEYFVVITKEYNVMVNSVELTGTTKSLGPGVA